MFVEYNQYPQKLVENVINQVYNSSVETTSDRNNLNNKNDFVTLALPYRGMKGEQILSKMKKQIAKLLSKYQNVNNNVKVRTLFKTKKLSSKFQVKDKTKPEHTHNIVYTAKCPNKECTAEYGGQTKCRLLKRVIQHNRTDKNSHLLKHARETGHHRVWLDDFKIVGQGYSSEFKRKISESLYIKESNPNLNIQKTAYNLTLFN